MMCNMAFWSGSFDIMINRNDKQASNRFTVKKDGFQMSWLLKPLLSCKEKHLSHVEIYVQFQNLKINQIILAESSVR